MMFQLISFEYQRRLEHAELSMSASHSSKLTPMAGEKELKGSNPVKHHTKPNDLVETFLGQILVEHAEIITEIETGLEWGTLGQCSTSDMVNHRPWTVTHRIVVVLGSPAEIYLLHVGKEIAVKSAQFMIDSGADKHSGA